MNKIVNFTDRLVNLVSRLGTGLDKGAASDYVFTPLSPQQLEQAYRSAWLPAKIVDIPAMDAVRRWRSWSAKTEQITLIEAEEKRLGLKRKTLQALTRARLYGGAAIYIGTGDTDTSLPLQLGSMGRGSVKFLTVLTKNEVTEGQLEDDPLSPGYGKPRFYTLGNGVEVHPSRLAIFSGRDIPDDFGTDDTGQSWGDSILQSVYEQVKQADSTSANIASLVFEAKVDIFKLPNFMRDVGDEDYKKRVVERVRLANLAKGNLAALLMDKDEEYHQKQLHFAGVVEVLMAFMQLCSGAADIPLTRLLGQSPGGMNASGEHDLKNYYDRVSSAQELEMTPAMDNLDESIIRSALGSRPPEIFYSWNSLWQTSDTEKGALRKQAADTIKVVSDTGLIPEEALARSAVNLLTETGAMPGLEAEFDRFYQGPAGGDDEDERAAAAGRLADAEPRTLYVMRRVQNAGEILSWARSQGVTGLLKPSDLHVTIAYSRTPIDWMKVGDSFAGEVQISEGGPRLVEHLGKDGEAVALLFVSSELSWRHEEINRAGASWDWPDYQPHITLSLDWPGDTGSIEPYRGEILLGPEIFEEVAE